MNLASIFLMFGQGDKGGGGFQFVFLGLMIVVFYFFMIRPQAKKAKQQKTFLSDLQKGDKVVTTGGIYGKVIELKETTVLLQVDDNVKIRVDKAAIVKDMSDVAAQK